MSLKRSFLGLVVAGSLVPTAQADPVPPTILKWVKPYQTHSVELSSGVLRVTMARTMVSDDMYRAVAINGVCSALFGEAKGWGSAKIERIEVLNNLAAQGYALLDAKNSCQRIGASNDAEAKKVVAAQTVNCRAGNCRR